MEEVTAATEERLGLSAPNMQDIRRRDQVRSGRQGHNKCGGHSHQQGLILPERANAVFDVIPVASKNAPGDVNLALGIAQVAQYAGKNIPNGCLDFLANHVPPVDAPEKRQEYITIGGIIAKTQKDVHNFMNFVDVNMHDDYRKEWGDLTHEWWNHFQEAGRPAGVVLASTVGLAGTDISELTADELRPLARAFPTLSERRPRDHDVAEDEWPQSRRRRLFD